LRDENSSRVFKVFSIFFFSNNVNINLGNRKKKKVIEKYNFGVDFWGVKKKTFEVIIFNDVIIMAKL